MKFSEKMFEKAAWTKTSLLKTLKLKQSQPKSGKNSPKWAENDPPNVTEVYQVMVSF